MQKYYEYSVKEFIEKSKFPVRILGDNDAIFKHLADIMIETIQENNEKGEKTVMINPVGPVGQYPYFVKRVNQERIDLTHTWFINMDEYLTDEGEWVEIENPLSFRGFMKRNVYDLIDDNLLMSKTQQIFPDPHDLNNIPKLIKKLGKVDLTVGGIGITGHVAFNEPDGSYSNDDYLKLQTRKLPISPETRATNSIGDLHGALEEMPHECVTIGISEINSANRIVLGCFRDWHKGVVRRAACGAPTSEYPVTLLQNHRNIELYITNFVADMGLD